MTARTLPGSRSNREHGRSRENSRPRWRGSRRRLEPGRRGRSNGRRGPRQRAGDRLHLRRAARGRASSSGRSRPCSRRTSRSAACAGRPTGSTHATRRDTGSIATPSGTGRIARSVERYALGVRTPLDTAAMAQAGSVLVGRHDFSAFGAADRQPVRTVLRGPGPPAGVGRDDRRRADAFLRGMVRRIVAVLLKVGHGTMDEAGVAAALDAGRPALSGAVAPAQGIVPASGRHSGERPGGRRHGLGWRARRQT